MNFDLHSHKVQLVLSAITASVATYGAVTAYQTHARRKHRQQLNNDVLRALSAQENKNKNLVPAKEAERSADAAQRQQWDGLPDDLVREQLARVYSFFGDEGMAGIRKANVVVVGCGGVGSWAAVMLVTLSSLNRHATAMQSDVGTPKVDCIARTLKQISRNVRVDCRKELWQNNEEGEKLLEGADWVIDAIDNITTKVDLLKYCHNNSIKVFSSMGAGTKCDPTRIQISDISSTVYDPLARSVRRRLRLLGISSGIPVVYSTEVPGEVKLLPLADEEFEKGHVKELGVFDDFRVRILPVLGPLPAIFGLNIASYILCELAGKPIPNPMAVKGRKKLYERLYRDLLHREQKFTGQIINKLTFDEDDVGLLFDDLHRGRSTIPPHTVPVRPALVRWDLSQPLSLENCAVMESAEADRHMKECSGDNGQKPETVWGARTTEVVARRAEEIRRIRDWVM